MTPKKTGRLADDVLPHLVLSRFIGEMNGHRAYTRPLQLTLAGLGCLEFRRNGDAVPAPFPELSARTTMVHSGRGVILRLSKRGVSRQQLDQMWADTKFDDGFHGSLPTEIVADFIHPDTWPMVRQIVQWGPVETIERFHRFLRNEARRPLVDGSQVGLSERGLAFYITAVGILFRHIHELAIAEVDPALLEKRWDRELPKLPSASEFNARTTTGHTNTAPEAVDARRALAHADTELKKRLARAGTRGVSLICIRDRAFIGIMAALGPRKGSMVEDALVGSYLARGETRGDVPGLVGPALNLTVEKRRNGAPIKRWKPLPDEVGMWVEEYLDYANLAGLPEAPLWISGWVDRKNRVPDVSNPLAYGSIKQIVQRFWKNAGLPVRPPHAFRHLAEQLANEAGLDYLTDNPDARRSMSTQAVAEGLLDHAITCDLLGYKDHNNEPGRMKLAGIASKGLWEHLRGERGARKGIDRERLVAAKRTVEEVKARVGDVERRIEDLRRQRRAKVEHARKARENGGLTATEASDLILDLGLLASLLDDEQDDLVRRREEFHAARAELTAARTDLIPLPDDVTGDDDLDLVETLAQEDEVVGTAVEFVRDFATFEEAAKAFGISLPTMRRWANGRLPHGPGDPRNPWDATNSPIQTLSRNRRRLIVTDLDPARVAPSTLAALNEFRRQMPT
jgi:integrase